MLDYRIDRERSAAAHRRLVRTYRMEKADRVPVVEKTSVPLGYSIRQLALDEECMLRQQLADITASSEYDTDYVPFLEPWICVPIYAEALGGGGAVF